MILAAAAQSSQAVGMFIFAVASGLTVVMLGWIARSLRKYMGEHNWLMETTKANTKQIADNTKAIKRMLDQREKLINQGNRRRR